MTLEKNVKQVAQQIAATKIANGASLEGLTFETLVSEVEAKILALAAVHAEVPQSPTPAKGKLKARRGKATGGKDAAKVSLEDLQTVLTSGPHTLGDVASRYGVSTGVAKRAIKALGDKVVEGKADPEPGKKGKRATTYSIQG